MVMVIVELRTGICEGILKIEWEKDRYKNNN